MVVIGGLFSFIKNQPVRAFALLCVAVTTAYVMYMGVRHTDILSGPGWCNRALNADKITTAGDFDALQACIGLLTIQLRAIAVDSHVYAGVIAMCLLALMVIVVAGGHLSFAASKEGLSGNLGAGPEAEAAAEKVADAAVDKAAEIKGS